VCAEHGAHFSTTSDTCAHHWNLRDQVAVVTIRALTAPVR
jgi:hypothetical protein